MPTSDSPSRRPRSPLTRPRVPPAPLPQHTPTPASSQRETEPTVRSRAPPLSSRSGHHSPSTSVPGWGRARDGAIAASRSGPRAGCRGSGTWTEVEGRAENCRPLEAHANPAQPCSPRPPVVTTHAPRWENTQHGAGASTRPRAWTRPSTPELESPTLTTAVSGESHAWTPETGSRSRHGEGQTFRGLSPHAQLTSREQNRAVRGSRCPCAERRCRLHPPPGHPPETRASILRTKELAIDTPSLKKTLKMHLQTLKGENNSKSEAAVRMKKSDELRGSRVTQHKAKEQQRLVGSAGQLMPNAVPEQERAGSK